MCFAQDDTGEIC